MNRFLKIALVVLLVTPFFATAHNPNQSYIFLRVYEKDGIEGRFEINVVDINKILDLDLDKKADLEQLRPYVEELQAYMVENASFHSELGDHDIVLTDIGLMRLGLGNFLKIHFKLENTEQLPDNLNVFYDAIFEKDDTHTGFVIMEYNWKAGVINEEMNIVCDFAPGDTTDSFSLTEVSLWKGFVAMVKQGVWHIWIGIDHILFLLALILPSVVRRTYRKLKAGSALGKDLDVADAHPEKQPSWYWKPVDRFKPAFMYIATIVTFFTIAHTITLSLGALDIFTLPSRWVESIIALSIGLAAYHNIRPIFKGRDWAIAFVFGLFHGFGFASVLGDLGLTGENLVLSLLGFNLGVELGQIVIIAAIFPVLYLIRNLKLYPKLLVWLSALLIVISLYWFIERAFDIDLVLDDYLMRYAYQIAQNLGLR